VGTQENALPWSVSGRSAVDNCSSAWTLKGGTHHTFVPQPTMSMNRIFSLAIAAVPLCAAAQVNQKGTFHLGLGVSAGGHATQYVQNITIDIFGVPITSRTEENDGAATVLFPIDIQYGIAKPVSLGLFVEPGSYLDSSNTRSNGLVLFGFQPRAYIINHDRFTWMGSLQIGSAGLRIKDTENGQNTEALYRGPFFGLSSGVGFYFGEHIGLQLHARYMSTTFDLKEYEQNGASIDISAIEAELNTTGFALQASLALRF